LIVEHDMDFLRKYARSVTVMHAGKILSEGTVTQVQADPMVQEVYLGRSSSKLAPVDQQPQPSGSL
jgi:urea transport system ATP-binding protein